MVLFKRHLHQIPTVSFIDYLTVAGQVNVISEDTGNHLKRKCTCTEYR